MVKKYRVSFLEDLCKGCGLCEKFCPMGIIAINSERINSNGYTVASVTDAGKCVGCANCAILCPDSVIKIEVE